MNLSWVKSLSYSLPDELERLRQAGYFEEFKGRSNYHLNRENLPDSVKKRIELELNNINTLINSYTLDEEELILDIASYLPGFNKDDFERIKSDTDWIFVEGKKKYVNFSTRALFLTSPLLRDWPGSKYIYPSQKEVNDACYTMMKKGKLSILSDMRLYIHIESMELKGKNVYAHLPAPNIDGYAMKKVNLVDEGDRVYISDMNHNQSTAFLKKEYKEESETFTVRFECLTESDYMSYKDIETLNKSGNLHSSYEKRDLEEKAPCYIFSPLIKELSEKIVGDETDKLKIAKKIYDFITKEYQYAYVRDYIALDSLGEYFALRGRGDCGLQTSLYITLCRYNGIPARWQSGVVLDGKSGVHDWCVIYIENVGLRPVDCSYGGSRRFFGNEELREFYFGNIDPYRVVFNTDVQCEFDPPKKHYRFDPYDNQYGEAETDEGQIPEEHVNMGREIINLKVI